MYTLVPRLLFNCEFPLITALTEVNIFTLIVKCYHGGNIFADETPMLIYI